MGPEGQPSTHLVRAGVAHEYSSGRLVISSRGKRATVTTSGRLLIIDDDEKRLKRHVEKPPCHWSSRQRKPRRDCADGPWLGLGPRCRTGAALAWLAWVSDAGRFVDGRWPSRRTTWLALGGLSLNV
jgi:hypothetical protein